MCEPAYSENNLNFRLWLFFFLQKLDTVKEGILLELLFLNIYICHMGQLEEKICPRNDTFSDPRLQRCDRSLEQQDMQALGWFLITKTIVVHEDSNSCLKIHCKTMNNFFPPPPERKDNSSCHSICFAYEPILCCSSYKIWLSTIQYAWGRGYMVIDLSAISSTIGA